MTEIQACVIMLTVTEIASIAQAAERILGKALNALYLRVTSANEYNKP